MQKYENILELPNAHLERYEPGANIKISKGAKFRDIISKPFFVSPVRRDLRQQWMTYFHQSDKMTPTNSLYYDPATAYGFASFKKLLHASRQQSNVKRSLPK
jgi:hypothetical protein